MNDSTIDTSKSSPPESKTISKCLDTFAECKCLDCRTLISIVIQTSSTTHHEVKNIRLSSSVSHLIDVMGMCKYSQRLVFDGMIIDLNATVKAAGIQNGSTLKLEIVPCVNCGNTPTIRFCYRCWKERLCATCTATECSVKCSTPPQTTTATVMNTGINFREPPRPIRLTPWISVTEEGQWVTSWTATRN